MTDKGQLEFIKYKLQWAKENLSYVNVLDNLETEDVDWLIQQVEESARERAEWEIEARTQYAINKRLKKEIKQYRQALREIRNTDTTKEVYRLWAEQALKGEYRK